jgi:hypothetical protein
VGEGGLTTSFNIYMSHVKVFTSKNTEEGETFERKKLVSCFLITLHRKKIFFHYSLVPAKACHTPTLRLANTPNLRLAKRRVGV